MLPRCYRFIEEARDPLARSLRTWKGLDIFRKDDSHEAFFVIPEGEQYAYAPQTLCCHFAWAIGAFATIVGADPFPDMIERYTILDSGQAKRWIEQGKIPYLEKSTCDLLKSMRRGVVVQQLHGSSWCQLGVGYGLEVRHSA